nr:E3 SUMO-protein ligase ZBED1-like [Misgurnus anguillicaudatus]XP_055074038.1 E3 SUMO-protein ligase ZBED1-like [Misgurnus anguillicaudatus]XP_055074039.1 E3 SUMO-protein ligase ZBED1-like [Misgurnus anguillicaudatus]XP_055074040.1 E3 SUMO-protein ligase ZBED1-like [Misgurnus anguillicaudatus]
MRLPFTLAAMGRKLNDEKVNECHRAVTRFVVKGLHSFSTVDQPDFREMIRTINPRYKPPSRDYLSNSLIPAWYQVEKENLLSAVKDVTKAAITADGWTSLAQDHYLTVTLHYTRQGTTVGKVLKTKAVYEAQTGDAVAEEVEAMLKEFEVREKVVAATVDNAANMDVAVKKMQVLKISCFAHTLNLAAQKINKCSIICNWSARVRAIVVWMKRSHMAKVILKEKQQLLNLTQHSLIVDVKTRWNSLYLMIERFYEQFPAIQAVIMDPRIKKNNLRRKSCLRNCKWRTSGRQRSSWS